MPGGTYTSAAPYIDTGDTTGANNTVSRAYWIHYGYYWRDTPGPDHVYTFTLPARGDAQIQVSRTSGTYEPLIYILDGRFGCPAGTGQYAYDQLVAEQAPSGTGTVTLDYHLAYVPMNIPLDLFVDSAYNDSRGSGPYTVRFENLTVASNVGGQRTKFDFVGDSRSDLSVFRPRILQSLWGYSYGHLWTTWRTASDIPVPADYDGDGRVDQAVYVRDGFWHINGSNQGYTVIHFGLQSDKPVVGDYDGDGKADQAVYRDGTWYLLQSTAGFAAFNRCIPTDIYAPSDYDGDGKTDAAVFRNGTWYLFQSTSGVSVGQFGLAGDKALPSAYIP